MAVYNITLSDGVTIVSIADGSIDLTSADIPLVGQNSQLYGDDIAKAQLFMLENFANSTPPAINPLVGQLWYDNVNNNINVYNGATFDQMAPVAQGTVANAMLRFDGTDTWLEGTQLQLSASGVLTILDTGLTESGSFSHDGTNLITTVSASTDNWFIDLAGDPVVLRTGTEIRVNETANIAHIALRHDSTDAILCSFASTTMRIGGSHSNLIIDSGMAIEERPSPAADVAGYGQLWVRDDTPNILVFRDDTGTDFDLNAVGGAADHGTLSGLGDDDHAQYAEIANTETISSVWTYTARPAFNSAGAPMTVANTTLVTNLNADLLDGSNASAFAAVGDTVNLTGAQSPAGVKTFTDILKVNTGVGGAGQGVRVLGLTSSDSTNSGFFSVYHQDEGQEQGRFGTNAGTAAIEVRALTANLDMYSQNGLRLRLNDVESFMQVNPSINVMRWHQAGISGTDTTSAIVYDNSGVEHNVGYNETPELLLTSSRNVAVADIGKFIRRSTSTSRVLTVVTASGVPTGGSMMVLNDHTTGTLTVAQSGVTLEWVDGGGIAPLTGTRTIAYNGVVTLRKKSSTVWQIWGNGIS